MWSKTLPTPGFFGDSSVPPVPPKKPKFISVGGTGDCGFRAAAVAIMDNILDGPARDNQALAKYILELHSSYFEQQPISERLITPVEHLKKLVEAPFNRSRFVLELSDALRQVAVDELCSYPEKYPGAFVNNNEQTDPTSMRQRDTWIDESAIAALSNAIKIPVTVQVVEPDKQLHLSFTYNEDLQESNGSPITLQLQNRHYLAKVSNPGDFALLNPKALGDLEPISEGPRTSNRKIMDEQRKKDPEMPEILARIKLAEQALVDEYNKTSHRLQLMVSNGELTKDNLLEIYIEGMKKSDYLEGRVAQVGIEHGNQDFFKKAIERASGVEAVNLPEGNFDDQITNELVHAIARAISIGHMDHSVYENIERPSHRVHFPQM